MAAHTITDNASPPLSTDEIGRLLRSLGISAPWSIDPLSGGGNNRLYKITTASGSFLLKHYFTSGRDPRDRCKNEFAFATFLWENGVRELARPIGRSEGGGLALFEFLEGERPSVATADGVDRALDFLAAINDCRHAPGSEELPDSSEACFSITDHVAMVEKRIGNLKALQPADGADTQALRFASGELSEAWRAWKGRMESFGGLSAAHCFAPLPRNDRIISPSDFGFHNAIETIGGGLKFIDFEYAGWDDPAKTVGDFFNQVSVPVPPGYYEAFIARVGAMVADKAGFTERCGLLLPLYRIKWCCIILNHFLPAGSERRFFAGDGGKESKLNQLEKARRHLASLDRMEKEPSDGVS